MQKEKLKRALMIAYHFPPMQGGSGVLRTLKFATYLQNFNYQPIVLTINRRAYDLDRVNEKTTTQIPGNILVKRAFGLDTKQHLSLRGFYFSWMATPDRFVSWIPAAVFSGLRLIRKYSVSHIYSTSPYPSAHIIALILKRLTNKSWLADFRDPMWNDDSPLPPAKLKILQKVELIVVKKADHITVTTGGTRELFIKRYLEKEPDNISVIENGFDEEDFMNIQHSPCSNRPPFRMIHAGLLDPLERDPIPFFRAIKQLVANEDFAPDEILVELRAPLNERSYKETVSELGLGDVIHICPRLPHHEILRKMAEAHILLLFQGPSCNNQIPAKVYEYLRIGRPIVALTPEGSDTANLIRQTDAGIVVPPDEPDTIASSIGRLLKRIQSGNSLPSANGKDLGKFSRRHQTTQLAKLFDRMG